MICTMKQFNLIKSSFTNLMNLSGLYDIIIQDDLKRISINQSIISKYFVKSSFIFINHQNFCL